MSLSRQYSVAFIGAGWVVRKCYLPALERLSLRLASVFDLDPAVSRRLVEDCQQGVACQDLDRLLAEEPDLVIVATPNGSHASICLQVRRRGFGVLCEKPLARTRDEAAEIVDCDTGSLHVSSPFRFRRDVQALVRHVHSGELGQIYRIRINWTRCKGIPRPGSWYTNRSQSGGGVLTDLGPHVIDLGLLLLGEGASVASVRAWTGATLTSSPSHGSQWMEGQPEAPNFQIDVEDQASTQIVFDDRRLLEVNLSWAGYRSWDETRIEVDGSKGRAVLDSLLGYSTMTPDTPPSLRLWRGDAYDYEIFSQVRDPGADFGHMLKAYFEPQGDEIQPASGEQALKVVEIIQLAYADAARLGCIGRLPMAEEPAPVVMD